MSIPEATYPAYMTRSPTDRPTIFEHSAKNGYLQSHPFDPMHLALGADMRIDELTQANTYMQLIFGGPTPDDAIDNAYNHVVRQISEIPVEQESKVSFQNPLRFVPVGEADKDSLLQTFANQRHFYKGVLDTDVERFLKSRPTHNMIATTFYNKKANSAGQSLRYNHVSGENNLLDNDPNAIKNFYPQDNLSSRTYAPDGKGGRVPLMYQNVYGPDARSVPLTEEARFPAEISAQDLGLYSGNELDNYQYSAKPMSAFEALFNQTKMRS